MNISIKRSEILLKDKDWLSLSERHHYKVSGILNHYLSLRSSGKKHAVLDFLFEYYSFRPGKISNWNPGIDYQMSSDWIPSDKLYSLNHDGYWQLNSGDFPLKRIGSLEWVITLLQGIENRPMAFGCFGLHEWAMVYKSPKVRHESHPLRLKPEEISTFLESQPVRCSHFDAFRFFTESAKPLNLLQPSYDTRLEYEQGGCIHANMDLYKWAYKFHPWVSSEILTEAFLLAFDTRQFDMMASPYDLSEYNLEPIKIETEEGRALYQMKQMEIGQKATQVRKNLLQCLINLQAWIQKGNQEHN
jgi:hypothetical protein